ncbi:AMP-dependent synthetase/ligase [Aeromicrobium chenweiae]|uniref:Long-chain fatty acid--CoA ligase n=1 Tax=Aeromicrobium chenweiae TaxID=2079793 RepID=A0A2S0WLK9_9ACTN|nr:AMP-binding protein [Aeromicrobium chenweiae]AWB92201.1 long-chain fatty acid--CoA ligase [Aeromicrobium chenweiae]TGN31515.1 long-chain fatty acid--CoA ligase [Aeromicrobium chenweiae]
MSDPDTLVSAFRATVAGLQGSPALRSSDGRIDLSWSEYGVAADRIAAGFAGLGVRSGDTVAILMGNRPEWQLADTGALIAGATPFSLYTSAPPDQNLDLLARSGAKVLVADVALLEGLRLPDELVVVEVDGTGATRMTFEQLRDVDATDFTPPVAGPGDVATLIYTSGTTGPPKGVELTHSSILFMVGVFNDVQPLSGGRTVSYLPHAHIVDRIVGHYLGMVAGSSVTSIDRPMAVFEELPRIRPTLFTSVPRIWQRLHSAMMADVRSRPEPERSSVLTAIVEAEQRVERQAAGVPIPEEVSAEMAEAEDTWFSPLRQSFGLDAVGWFITGSAPLPRATHIFFAAIGMPLHDLWGLSETVAVATLSVPGDHHLGTVGRPVPGTDVRLADDGEVLIRGPHLAVGYKDDPAATSSAFDADGWFHSGDIGEWRDGRLAIIDRKKEMIISAGGENMSPSRIESVIASASPLVGGVVVVGDARAYNVALVVPDFTEVSARLGVSGSADTVISHPAVRAEFSAVLEDANGRLSRPERVRRHLLLLAPWTVESGELTPTLKVRRQVVESNHAVDIENLYAPVDSSTSADAQRIGALRRATARG